MSEKGDELRYFTNSPFERLMMEKPCGQSKAADAAWREYEDNERKKRRCAEGRMRERPPSCVLIEKREK